MENQKMPAAGVHPEERSGGGMNFAPNANDRAEGSSLGVKDSAQWWALMSRLQEHGASG
jgi:hypothetical protein